MDRRGIPKGPNFFQRGRVCCWCPTTELHNLQWLEAELWLIPGVRSIPSCSVLHFCFLQVLSDKGNRSQWAVFTVLQAMSKCKKRMLLSELKFLKWRNSYQQTSGCIPHSARGCRKPESVTFIKNVIETGQNQRALRSSFKQVLINKHRYFNMELHIIM